MPAPNVYITWDDQSTIPPIGYQEPRPEANVDYPIYMTTFTSDKGPEEWQFALEYPEFTQYYGKNASFYRHGQPLTQAHYAGSSKARLTCKRVVAEDATLANIGEISNQTKNTLNSIFNFSIIYIM